MQAVLLTVPFAQQFKMKKKKKIKISLFDTSSVQFSRSVMSDSLRPLGLQHAKASLSITNSQSMLKLMDTKTSA